MFFGWLKRYTPRGLYGRAALILIVPVTVLMLIVSIIFIQRHYEDVTRQMTRALALELRMIMAEIDAAETLEEANARAHRLAEPLQIELILPSNAPPQDNMRAWLDLSGNQVINVLRGRLKTLIAVDLVSEPRDVTLWVDTRHGPAEMTVGRRRVAPANPHQFLLLTILVAIIMLTIAFLFLRNQLRPIRRLARAAEAFGRGRVVPYKPSGALEVRSAGNAFLDMRARIERQIEQRTLMLSGVSHDLRTPLTRMKLALSLLDDHDTAAELARDVEEMERLLNEFLAFARGDALDDPGSVDAAALVRETVTRMPGAAERVQLNLPAGPVQAILRPMAFARVVTNLVGNALRYGSRARVSLLPGEKSLTLRVEDDGPGIPEERREEALKPFVRLDAARNQDRGSGVGLGLSIAQDIARRHGGSLRLGQSPDLGGLMVEVVLPR